jgi:Family of unknown function (DUF6516)
MKAKLLFRVHIPMSEGAFAKLVAWSVPKPVLGSDHSYKYRFAYVVDGLCVIRYDNERGKGDHRHIQDIEYAYKFSDLRTLRQDFMRDVESYGNG